MACWYSAWRKVSQRNPSKSLAERPAHTRCRAARLYPRFDNLEWDRFRSFFADDASVFYPRGFAHRAHGRAESEANFGKVFEQIRAGRTHPPYMNLQPRDLEIQGYGEIAIAAFHLDHRRGVLKRRTIVLRRMKGQWKMVHLHASETALSP